MLSNLEGHRKPKERYKNRNGFTETFPAPRNEKLQEAEAIEAQDIARFIQREMGSYFPSREKMKEIVETPETLASVKEQIAKLTEENRKDMAKLYAAYAQDVKCDTMDAYFQTGGRTDDMDNNLWRDYQSSVEEFHQLNFRVQATEFANLMERFRYEHLQVMMPLYKRRVELERSEEEDRINRAARFPLSSQEYRAIEVRAAQLRVAHFLMHDESKREQMRTESRWAWRQTQPLIDEYRKDPSFRMEIQKMVQEVESRDPRSRRP